ncbi:MAG TPA: transposase [Hanamia sp.]|nr:transposase [Hanamia sp.]
MRNEYREVLIESWKYCQKEKDLEIYTWCVMTSHVHVIIGSRGRELEKFVGEMKSFTSRSLRKEIRNNPAESRKEWLLWMMETAGKKNSNNNDWQLWQQHNHPVELLNKEMFYQKLEYIHQNPVVAGFVTKEEEYLYSSARNYYDGKGLIELSFIG